MHSQITKRVKYITGICSGLLLVSIQPALAAGPPAPSILSNTVALFLIALMILLLACIAIMGKVLLYVAKISLHKEKEKQKANTAGITASIVAVFLLFSMPLFAQTLVPDAGAVKSATDASIAGMSSEAFYMMMSVIFLELVIILAMLYNMNVLLKSETLKLAIEKGEAKKIPALSWWDRFNSFRPAEQEADIDLGHDYDGIRELDNRLPPWWIYGFYITILSGCIYLYRFHVSHTGLSNVKEYELSVIKADQDIKEYIAKKGDAVDENTVTVLSTPDDLAAGKTIFMTTCIACHTATGGGSVGPNLTDDYWLHGGSIKNIFKTIRYGVNAMPQWQNTYSNKQIAQVASYVKSLRGTNPPNPKAPQGELYKEEAAQAAPVADSAGKANKEPIKDSLKK